MIYMLKQGGGWFFVIVCCIFIGCTEKESTIYDLSDEKSVTEHDGVFVEIPPTEHVDSAQVFFFRMTGDTDTLISREIVYDIAFFKPHLFHFDLPAGKYLMVVYGNIPTEYIVYKSPYSSKDIYFDYNAGRRPSEIFYGRAQLNVGVDTVNFSPMVALSGYVHLTVQKVPEGVDRMIVRLLNTAAGITITNGYIQEAMNPPLADTISDVQMDSSYVASFYCFPGIGTDANSTLEVECYDSVGKLIYSGKSAPFYAVNGYSHMINCSFADATGRSRRAAILQSKLYFVIRKV